MTDENRLTQKDFAESQGWSRSYVTQLKQADRLVTEGEGRKLRVLVKESLGLIEKTKDPNRDDVSNRHAAERSGKPPKEPDAPEAEEAKHSFQRARAKKEHFLAKKAELEFEREQGTVCEIERVRLGGMDAGAHIRTSLENLRPHLSQLLASESDPVVIDSILADSFEQILNDMADNLQKLAEVE